MPTPVPSNPCPLPNGDAIQKNSDLTALVPGVADSSLVMATENVHDVVNQTQSVGDLSPSDALATTQNQHITGGEEKEGLVPKQDGDHERATYALPIDDTNSSAYSQNALSSVSWPEKCPRSMY
jgi:hypothetical protein